METKYIALKPVLGMSGNNQENAAYPSGLCAERVAIFFAQAQYPNIAINSLAVYVQSKVFKTDELSGPCGACRQVMLEYENKYSQDIRIIMAN